jgi:thiol:disulfide interchange protein DsbG
MKLAHLALPLIAVLAINLAGCSPKESADKAAASRPAQPYEAVAAQGKGFTVGAMMSANTVYVLFDPQCPHCGRLWEASVPLHNKVRFVWIPINFGNPKSTPQGAALLSAANPAQLMTEHEKSLLSGGGGIAASSSVPSELEQAIKNNTQLLNSLGVESVPYILAKNSRTGQVVSNTGAMDTPALAEFLGVSQP